MSDPVPPWPLGGLLDAGRLIAPKTFPLTIGIAVNDGEAPRTQLVLHADGRIEGDLDGARAMLANVRGKGEMGQVIMWLLVRALGQDKGEIEG
jgi:hypothetical protein